MATDAQRDRKFRSTRTARSQALPRIQRDTDREIQRLLAATRRSIRATLANGPSEYQSWHLPQLEKAVDDAMRQFGADAGQAAAAGHAQAAQAGVDGIDGPIDAAMRLDAPDFALASALPAIDTRQLEAMRAFTTHKMRGIAMAAADKINTDLGLALLGAQTVEVAAANIARVAGRIDPFRSAMSRARTVVRTELGRAYSVAGQKRMEQAAQELPGLRKQWRRSGALHARITHDHADGQVRPVDEKFMVGGEELNFPRDPAGTPGNTINCGCQSLPWMANWDVRQGGRQPFTDEEIARDRRRADLQRYRFPSLEMVPPKLLGGWQALGARVQRHIVELAGGVDDPEFAPKFRQILRRELKERRGAGQVAADILAAISPTDEAAALLVQEAASLLPASWVRAGNRAGKVRVIDNRMPTVRGAYYHPKRRSEVVEIGERKVRREQGTPMIHTNPNPGSALHEYTHHLQAAMPGLDEHFQKLHRRRTKGERRARLPGHGPEVEGRRDQYVDSYFGREYANDSALEVMTRAVESTFHPLQGLDLAGKPSLIELLPSLVRKDPGMLDLTLGLLFRYDPP